MTRQSYRFLGKGLTEALIKVTKNENPSTEFPDPTHHPSYVHTHAI